MKRRNILITVGTVVLSAVITRRINRPWVRHSVEGDHVVYRYETREERQNRLFGPARGPA